MFNAKNQDVLYKILSSIFAVIIISYVLIYREVIDLIYLGIISLFILIYFIENKRK